MSRRIVLVSGPSALRTHLRTELSNISRAPCLFVSSSSSALSMNGARRSDWSLLYGNGLEDVVKRAAFVIRLELNLSTFSTQLSSAYPTSEQVQGSIDLAKRCGINTIIGVGSGAAMDLAKSVSHSPFFDEHPVSLILAPATLPAVMASMSSITLLLSTQQQSLTTTFPLDHHSTNNNNNNNRTTTVALDETAIVIPTSTRSNATTASLIDTAALSSLAIALDTAYFMSSQTTNDPVVQSLLESTVKNALLALPPSVRGSNKRDTITHTQTRTRYAIAAVSSAGQLLSFHHDENNVPLTISMTLLPRYFPHCHLFTFWACLLPGICAAATLDENPTSLLWKSVTSLVMTREEEQITWIEWAERATRNAYIPTLSFLAEGNTVPDIMELLDQFDVMNTTRIETVLRYSLHN